MKGKKLQWISPKVKNLKQIIPDNVKISKEDLKNVNGGEKYGESIDGYCNDGGNPGEFCSYGSARSIDCEH